MSTAVLEALAHELRAEGGLLAGAVREEPVAGAQAPHGDLAAAGPRAGDDPDDYALVVEAVREGYLLHYGRPRILDTPDPDLALLAGDRLYALGLARLAERGDLAAVAELADVIALCAVAHGSGDAELADAVWWAGAQAVGWGATERHEQAKSLARGAQPGAAGALLGAWPKDA